MSGEILKRGMRLGRYEIREMLGRGGMGEVYRAWDPSLRRDVAIKVLGAPDEELLQRFSREAEAISQINHPNVVSILDFSAGPTPYIVMAHLRGEDLASRLKRGRMSVGEAVDIILGVCAGVHACHTRGVIHRDLKPGNVFLHETPEGIAVKVLDFGVAILGENVSGELTRPGNVVGTPRYFSPEQVRHQNADAKSDQYAVALLLYVILLGKSPFAHKTGPELVRAILKAEYARLLEVRPDVPPGLESAILRGLSVQKELRFASVLDFGRAIAKHATSEGQVVFADPFASADRASCPATCVPPAPAVQSAMTNVTTLHTVSTANGWTAAGGGGADEETSLDTTGEKSPRSVMAAAVVFPLSPLGEEIVVPPVMPPTERLRSETEIDVGLSQNDNGVRVVKTLDLHLWSKEPSSPSREGPHDSPPPVSAGFWQRNRPLAIAIAAGALLGCCIVWLIARGWGR